MRPITNRNNFLYLFLSLIVFLFSAAVVAEYPGSIGEDIFSIVTMLMLIVSIKSLKSEKTWMWAVYALIALFIILTASEKFFEHHVTVYFTLAILLIFFIGSFMMAAKQVLFVGDIDGNKIIGSQGSVKFYKDISRRLMGDKGDEWAELSTATIRGVVNGVIGVALLQGILSLIFMAFMDVPLAIVWAVLIMFVAILQLPALIISGPVIAYVFSQGSGTPEVIFAILMVIVAAGDGAIKPFLMGRGVDAPMLVIMIGAIGGMMLMGMIGLFVGAVIFALAYKLFTFWMAEIREETEAEEAQS